ncbi:MAG TPA: collagen-binding domain-containing protein [Nocardioides sp.]|nr:collagen-binding domain-containing protein [Nocardioides sp.]
MTTAAAMLGATGVVALETATAPPAHALAPVNPVRVLNGNPANSGFLVFVENDVTLRNDESEGTLAMGGNLRIQRSYNIAAHAPKDSTFTDEGDSGPTFLYVGGGIRWEDDNAQVRVLNQGFTKVADTTTYTAHVKDQNNAPMDYRLTRPGRPASSQPYLEGNTKAQTVASIAHRPSNELINVGAAFDIYRILTRELAACPANVQLVNPDSNLPLTSPFASGARGKLTLTPGVTNVLTVTAADLANLSEITYTNQPTATTPLLINVTGDQFTGRMPNHPGASGSQAPYILWNFPDATTIKVTGGDSQEGTIYAPHAKLTWVPTANIEGNVIASYFNHGDPSPGRNAAPREIHDFPFNAKLSCAAAPRPPTATLTLEKKVINDDNGSAQPSDWTLKAVGATPMRGRAGSRAVRRERLDPGSYVLLERGPDGYDSLGWSCDGGTLVGEVITLADGDDVTCTLTNDDTPGARPPDAHLTLVKRVVNDDGGSAIPGDWVLHADGPTPLDGRSGSDAVTSVKVRHGVYSLTESPGPGHYRSRGWECTGGTMTGRRQVRVEDGDTVVCTVTNDDVAQTGVSPIGPS